MKKHEEEDGRPTAEGHDGNFDHVEEQSTSPEVERWRVRAVPVLVLGRARFFLPLLSILNQKCGAAQ